MSELKFETENANTLLDLETTIVSIDSISDDLTDLEVIDVLNYLIRAYTAKGNGPSAPFVRLSPLKRGLADAITGVADYLVAPVDLETDSDGEMPQPSDVLITNDLTTTPVTLDVLIACIQRIRQSAKHWNATHGRRGYLDFVGEFVR